MIQMKTIDKVLRKLIVAACAAFLAIPSSGSCAAFASDSAVIANADSIAVSQTGSVASLFGAPLNYNVALKGEAFYVPQTNMFLEGENPEGKRISSGAAGDIRAGFSFDAHSRAGMLYHGIYQGIGVGAAGFFGSNLLGTPVSAYVYQGAPIAHFSPRLWLGYEWEFGAAFGWKHYDKNSYESNVAVSTAVTARMGVGVKLHWLLTERWLLSFGAEGRHFSNGNTSWPNKGVNSLGLSVGLTYLLSEPQNRIAAPQWLAEDADRKALFFDAVVFGAWRKRAVALETETDLCPGVFGVVGFQVSPMMRLNRWVAAGVSLDMQYDESAGLAPYWVDGSYDEDIKFVRPPFGKQLSLGLSAHAELTTPIFAINAGLGYDFINPVGNKRFYQMLTLKTFVTDRLFLNVGYRLADFKQPSNLMLGVGYRFGSVR